MAIYGLKRLLIPDSCWDEVAALLERHGGHVRPFHDISEGRDVHILCFTGRPPADKPLHWH